MHRNVTLHLHADRRLINTIEMVNQVRIIVFLGMTEVSRFMIKERNEAICLHEMPRLQVLGVRWAVVDFSTYGQALIRAPTLRASQRARVAKLGQ